MAAWKMGRDDDSERRDGEDTPSLFGNFRRSESRDDSGEKPRSMTEMWGFESEDEWREARRRRFWAAEPRDDMEWTPGWGAAAPPVPRREPEPVVADAWAPEADRYAPDLEEAGFEPAFDAEAPAPVFEQAFEPASNDLAFEPEFAPAGDDPALETAFALDSAPDLDAERFAPAFGEGATFEQEREDEAAFAHDGAPASEVAAEAPAPAASGRMGWRSFLAEVSPAAQPPVMAAPPPPARANAPERDEPVARLARRLASGATVHPLVLETSVQLGAAAATCTQLGRSWGETFAPTIPDLAIRALGRALLREPELKALAAGIAVLDLGAEQGTGCLLDAPAERPFREAVGALAAMDGGPLDEIDVSVTDYGLLSIERATPRLAPGQWIALALGMRTFGAVQSGDGVEWRPVANICLAYDGQRVGDGAAARLLSRLRSLLEAPDDLIA